MTPATKLALTTLNDKEGNTHGTANLIESLRAEFGFSYSEIAEGGQVSVAGLTRWRQNNYGEQSRVAALIEWAKSKIDPEGHSATKLRPAEAMRNHAVGQIENHLADALRKLLGSQTSVNLKISDMMLGDDGAVTLSVRVE